MKGRKKPLRWAGRAYRSGVEYRPCTGKRFFIVKSLTKTSITHLTMFVKRKIYLVPAANRERRQPSAPAAPWCAPPPRPDPGSGVRVGDEPKPGQIRAEAELRRALAGYFRQRESQLRHPQAKHPQKREGGAVDVCRKGSSTKGGGQPGYLLQPMSVCPARKRGSSPNTRFPASI